MLVESTDYTTGGPGAQSRRGSACDLPILGPESVKGRPARFTRIAERVAKRDEEWFERHPDESAYVRVQVPGEHWPLKLPQGIPTFVMIFEEDTVVGGIAYPPGRYRAPVSRNAAVRVRHDGRSDIFDRTTGGLVIAGVLGFEEAIR